MGHTVAHTPVWYALFFPLILFTFTLLIARLSLLWEHSPRLRTGVHTFRQQGSAFLRCADQLWRSALHLMVLAPALLFTTLSNRPSSTQSSLFHLPPGEDRVRGKSRYALHAPNWLAMLRYGLTLGAVLLLTAIQARREKRLGAVRILSGPGKLRTPVQPVRRSSVRKVVWSFLGLVLLLRFMVDAAMILGLVWLLATGCQKLAQAWRFRFQPTAQERRAVQAIMRLWPQAAFVVLTVGVALGFSITAPSLLSRLRDMLGFLDRVAPAGVPFVAAILVVGPKSQAMVLTLGMVGSLIGFANAGRQVTMTQRISAGLAMSALTLFVASLMMLGYCVPFLEIAARALSHQSPLFIFAYGGFLTASIFLIQRLCAIHGGVLSTLLHIAKTVPLMLAVPGLYLMSLSIYSWVAVQVLPAVMYDVPALLLFAHFFLDYLDRPLRKPEV